MFVSSYALVFNTEHGVFKCEGNTTDAVSNNKKNMFSSLWLGQHISRH